MRLGVFLSDERGLRDWQRVGSLTRELALYRELCRGGWQIDLFTYDRWLPWLELGFEVRVHPQWPWLLPRSLDPVYQRAQPWRFGSVGRTLDVAMTNQAHAAEGARRASVAWQVPLVARSGYVFGEQAEVLGWTGPAVRARIERERTLLRGAAASIFPSPRLRAWACTHYGLDAARAHVAPAFLDTAAFAPQPRTIKIFDVTVVARLDPVKNHRLILQALAGRGWSAHFIGDGPLRRELLALARRLGVRLHISRRVPHAHLPRWLCATRAFVLASTWEGHPKALVEAMACGCACVVSDIPAHRELVDDGQNGLRVPPQATALGQALARLLDDPGTAARLGRRARRTAEEQHALARVCGLYEQVLRTAIGT